MPVSRIKVKNRHLKKKAKKPLAFYNGMPLDDYIVLTHMTTFKQNRFY